MENLQSKNLNSVLIVAIIPYFLEKRAVWFEENLKTILDSQKTQSFFEDNTAYIEKNQKYNLSEFLRKIDELGYEKTQKITEPGEFSQLGGIVELFPINTSNAVRFDFLGNKIESIEVLDIKIEDEEKARELLKKKLKSQKIYSELKGIKPGDYLVHLDHGICRFTGIKKFQIQNYKLQINPNNEKSKSKTDDYYVLEYADGDKLFVPIGLERKLSRYVGFTEPKISRLGSSLWQKTKRKIKEEAEKIAKELLEIYASREIAERLPYLQDDEFDFQVSESFKYQETPDQLEAIKEIKKDMESKKPMDRLVCGDVGFGKTEVALRAIIKAVKSGRQAVMISPTTILANQHFENFKERLKEIPVEITLLTRLQTKKQEEKIINKIKNSKIDILVGTHKILSDKISPLLFGSSETGLLIIDDEQKFGVKQKEKLKQLRSKIDILSLSATPIPRTLHLAMSSIKDISLIQTPPQNRLPIKTIVAKFSKKLVKEAIEKEILRNGQVYYLHNRIGELSAVKDMIENLVLGVKISIIHSKMKEKQIMEAVENFRKGKINILLATTIIENGLDVQNANTIIIEDTEKLGLSQAHQIRGRVGRSHINSFAYFLYKKTPRNKHKLRLEALKEAKELGAGYRLALRDMEIRGAGNILGKEQSGIANQVGLNLYCQMIAEAVEKIRIARPAP